MIESLSNIASIHQYSKVLHGENNSYSLIITASIKVSCCIYADKPAMIKSFYVLNATFIDKEKD